MRDLVDKINNTSGPVGLLQADEWNDRSNELENATTDSGQTLTQSITNQLSRSIGMGGKRTTLSSGTLEPGETAFVDNSSGPVFINLPLSPDANVTVHFEPTFGNLYSTNILIVGRNGKTIRGIDEDMIVGFEGTTITDNHKFSMTFDSVNNTWQILFVGKLGK